MTNPANNWYPPLCNIKDPYTPPRCSQRHLGYEAEDWSIPAAHLDQFYIRVEKRDAAAVTVRVICVIQKEAEVATASGGSGDTKFVLSDHCFVKKVRIKNEQNAPLERLHKLVTDYFADSFNTWKQKLPKNDISHPDHPWQKHDRLG